MSSGKKGISTPGSWGDSILIEGRKPKPEQRDSIDKYAGYIANSDPNVVKKYRTNLEYTLTDI